MKTRLKILRQKTHLSLLLKFLIMFDMYLKTYMDVFQLYFQNGYTQSLNPIAYGVGGGGGDFGPNLQIIDYNSKTAQSTTSNLGDFLFLSIRHNLAEF